RPQRSRAAAIAAASVASLVTSAANATHSPPLSRAMAAVSSADARSRSTASTFAPSWANRMVVARPLPMPVPGPWPAPTTTAIFPASRMVSSSLSPNRIAPRRSPQRCAHHRWTPGLLRRYAPRNDMVGEVVMLRLALALVLAAFAASAARGETVLDYDFFK